MKRILTLALAVLPLAAVPTLMEPAAAQVLIRLGNRSDYDRQYDYGRDRQILYDRDVHPNRRKWKVQQRRRNVQSRRRIWVPSRWEYSNGNRRRGDRDWYQQRRVLVPGHYRYFD